MGLDWTLKHHRVKYVVVHGRETVKELIKEWTDYQRRFLRKVQTQQISPLPGIRLETIIKPSTNFNYLAGPYKPMSG